MACFLTTFTTTTHPHSLISGDYNSAYICIFSFSASAFDAFCRRSYGTLLHLFISAYTHILSVFFSLLFLFLLFSFCSSRLLFFFSFSFPSPFSSCSKIPPVDFAKTGDEENQASGWGKWKQTRIGGRYLISCVYGDRSRDDTREYPSKVSDWLCCV